MRRRGEVGRVVGLEPARQIARPQQRVTGVVVEEAVVDEVEQRRDAHDGGHRGQVAQRAAPRAARGGGRRRRRGGGGGHRARDDSAPAGLSPAPGARGSGAPSGPPPAPLATAHDAAASGARRPWARRTTRPPPAPVRAARPAGPPPAPGACAHATLSDHRVDRLLRGLSPLMTRSRSLPLPLLILAPVLALACAAPAHGAGKDGPRTAAGWRVTPAGTQFGVSRRALGFQGPLASVLTPGSTKLLSVSSGAARANSADLFDMRARRRSSSIRYDARRGIGEAVFYGVAMSPDGLRAWASGGGQDVVHAYSLGPPLREVATIPVRGFPAGMAYGSTPHGDRLYVANNLAGRAGDTNPPGHTVTVIDPATNAVVKVIDLGMAAQPFGVT